MSRTSPGKKKRPIFPTPTGAPIPEDELTTTTRQPVFAATAPTSRETAQAQARLTPTPNKAVEQPTGMGVRAARAYTPGTEEEDTLDKQVKAATKKLNQYEKMLPDSEESRKQFAKLREQARQDYKDRRNTVNWLQVAETVGNALMQYGAARAGGDKADMSNLRLSKSDWNNVLRQASEDYGMDLTDIREQEKMQERAVKDYSSQIDKLQSLELRLAQARERRAELASKYQQAAEDTTERRKLANENLKIRQEQVRLQAERDKARTAAAKEQEKIVEKQEMDPRTVAAMQLTDDPATAKMLANAALDGKDELESVMKSASVQKKLRPNAVAAFQYKPWFRSSKTDYGKIADMLRKADQSADTVVSTQEEKPVKDPKSKKARGPDGKMIYSADGGETWVDEEGNPVE